MNTITRNLRFSSNILCTLTKSRGYASQIEMLKSVLHIKWNRPEKIPCIDPKKSGDLGLGHKITGSDIIPKYKESKELEDANDLVKRMFTLSFQPEKALHLARTREHIDSVKRHKLDESSMETRLTRMTTNILRLQELMQKHPRNRVMKVQLKELIDKRKKLLKYLRRWDYKRFEWLLEKLNLIYKPHPGAYIGVHRRRSLRKLTTRYCNQVVQKKLDQYKAELEAQQKDFFNEKAKKLAFIRSEELACGIEPTVSEEEIEAARTRAESVK